MSAVQIKKLTDDMAKINAMQAELMAQLSKLTSKPAPKPASKPAPKLAPAPSPASIKRMTDAEFMAMGQQLGETSDGKVAGGKFPKAILPLYMGKVLSLVEVAEKLDIPVIRSDDPKQTHIYLDFSKVKAAPAPAPAPKPAPKTAPPKPVAKEEKQRMTDAEFLAMGKKLGEASDGKVAGGKFSKATLPLYMGKELTLVEVAEMLGVPVIRSDDPKKTHIYLDFSEPVEAKVEEKEEKEEKVETKVEEKVNE